MLGFSECVGRALVLESVELGVSFSGTGGDVRLSGSAGAGEACSLERGSAGTGGVPPSCEISMRGFAGTRDREPDVAFEAALPGRGGRTSVARGASSESSEASLSSEYMSLARDLLRGRSARTVLASSERQKPCH